MTPPLAEFVTDHAAWEAVGGLQLRCLGALEAAAGRMPARRPGTAVILFSDDETLHALNRRYRGKDQPTNVLSFPAPEREGYPGDIALAFETCAREADLAGLALIDRATHLALHGFLHLNGYDHQTEDDASVMESLERAALADLGIGDPYLIRSS